LRDANRPATEKYVNGDHGLEPGDAGRGLTPPFRPGEDGCKAKEAQGARSLVEIGQNNGEVAEVRAGLKPGEPVVLHPGQSVADGTANRRASRTIRSS